MTAARAHQERIPLNTLAIGFGTAGLAETWSLATDAVHGPRALDVIPWLAATATWAWLLIAHLARGARTRRPLREQLRNPVQGPIAALAPTTGMLIGAELYKYSTLAGTVLVVASIAIAFPFAAWLIGTWFEGGLDLAAVHGGYLLPTVATGLVGADSTAAIGLPAVGWALFGIGAFFTAVMTTLLILRLAVGPSLPGPLVPTMAILLAPPAVAAIAWFGLVGHHDGPIAEALAGVTVLFFLGQVALFGRYRRLSFSLGFWSFTFPLAAFASFTILWLPILGFTGWQWAAVLIAILLTVFDLVIATRSVASARTGRTSTGREVPRSADVYARLETVPHEDSA